MSDGTSSAAYAALSKTARRMLGVIQKAIGKDGSAAISFTDFMFTHRIGRPSISKGLKQLDALGMIEIARGPRAGNVFRLSNRWRAINADEAARLAREARTVLPQRRHEKRREPVQPLQPVPETHVEPVPFMAERKPSLPTLAWLDGR
jgi:hypothetical protein